MNTAAIIIALGLILVITILSTIIGGLVYQIDKNLRRKNTPEELSVSVQDAIEVAFRKREQEFLTIYAEERRLADWIENQLDSEKVSLAELATEANARALALAIKMAEDEVLLAADTLTKILQKKARAEYQLADCTRRHMDASAAKERDVLKMLSTQEVEARDWLDKAKKNLEKVSEVIDASTEESTQPT